MFENVKSKRNPIGIEFIKRGLLTESQVDRVLQYQNEHRELKFGEIVDVLEMCDKKALLDVLSYKLQLRPVMLNEKLDINPQDYMPRDMIITLKAIPFKKDGNKLSVAFADPLDDGKTKQVELFLMNAGYEMESFITLYTSIMNQINTVKSVQNKFVDKDEKDVTVLIDNIIATAIDKRASDIHVEPLEDKVRVRYRIDGELITVSEISKKRQQLISGRIKSISNMHQEITYDQDGSINTYPNYSIRVSSQKNVNGEKFVLRLLKKDDNVRELIELGFPDDEELVTRAFDKRNSIIIVGAPTGEGKTTTLYSVISKLNKDNINIASIENPVEMRIPGINQVEIGANITFASALRTVLRQDPDIVLVGEIRDDETAKIAIEAGQTGHLVLSTLHTIDAVEAITRIRKMGITDYDVASTLVTTISQRLVRRLCPKCKKKHELTEEDLRYINRAQKLTNKPFDIKNAETYEAVGCDFCNHTGYHDRIAIFEVLCIDDYLKDMVSEGKSTIDIREYARKNCEYEALPIDAVRKVLSGITTIEEVKRKIML